MLKLHGLPHFAQGYSTSRHDEAPSSGVSTRMGGYIHAPSDGSKQRVMVGVAKATPGGCPPTAPCSFFSFGISFSSLTLSPSFFSGWGPLSHPLLYLLISFFFSLFSIF